MKELTLSSDLDVEAAQQRTLGAYEIDEDENLVNRHPPIPHITVEMLAQAGGSISVCPGRCLGLGYQADQVLPHRVYDRSNL